MQALLGFLYRNHGVVGPRGSVSDKGSQEFECVNSLRLVTVDKPREEASSELPEVSDKFFVSFKCRKSGSLRTTRLVY